MPVVITEKMKQRAKEESIRRDGHIKHHFDVNHLSKEERDIIGFLGEFACCDFFGMAWEDNIRDNYLTIDSGDMQYNNLICDVKTETLPRKVLEKVYNRKIDDDEVWGRRLINKKQVSLLNRYHIVIFGGIVRGEQIEKWYPFGYLETKYILQNYEVTKVRPDGGEYPFEAIPVKTSDLKDLKMLFKK